MKLLKVKPKNGVPWTKGDVVWTMEVRKDFIHKRSRTIKEDDFENALTMDDVIVVNLMVVFNPKIKANESDKKALLMPICDGYKRQFINKFEVWDFNKIQIYQHNDIINEKIFNCVIDNYNKKIINAKDYEDRLHYQLCLIKTCKNIQNQEIEFDCFKYLTTNKDEGEDYRDEINKLAGQVNKETKSSSVNRKRCSLDSDNERPIVTKKAHFISDSEESSIESDDVEKPYEILSDSGETRLIKENIPPYSVPTNLDNSDDYFTDTTDSCSEFGYNEKEAKQHRKRKMNSRKIREERKNRIPFKAKLYSRPNWDPPKRNIKYLRFFSKPHVHDHLRKVMLNEIKSIRHQGAIEWYKRNQSISHMYAVIFSNQTYIRYNHVAESYIKKLLYHHVFVKNRRQFKKVNNLQRHFNDFSMENYVKYCLIPEGYIYFISKEKNINLEEAEQIFYRTKYERLIEKSNYRRAKEYLEKNYVSFKNF